jgi:tetratricopeptide (TPR) repeat protein
VGVLAYNWGWRLDGHGNPAEAALAFARSLGYRRMEKDAPVVRTTEFALAMQLRKLGLVAQALAIQERLLEEATTAKEPIGSILVEKVEDLSALGRPEEARAAVAEALRAPTVDELSARQVERLRELAKAQATEKR